MRKGKTSTNHQYCGSVSVSTCHVTLALELRPKKECPSRHAGKPQQGLDDERKVVERWYCWWFRNPAITGCQLVITCHHLSFSRWLFGISSIRSSMVLWYYLQYTYATKDVYNPPSLPGLPHNISAYELSSLFLIPNWPNLSPDSRPRKVRDETYAAHAAYSKAIWTLRGRMAGSSCCMFQHII